MNIFNLNDNINFESKLKSQISKVLKTILMGKQEDTSQTFLIIGVVDTNMFSSLRSSDFINDLRDYLANNDGFCFAKIELVDYVEENWTGIEEYKSISLFLAKQKKPQNSRQSATISIFSNTGSLKQDSYKLDSDDEALYLIGRGEETRENDIVIDDSQDSTFWNNNKYVRSAHAHITYQTDEGYLLWADPNGTPVYGSRTRIIRKGIEVPIDLRTAGVPQQLIDGDKIELGKHVKLLFKINH